MGGEDQPLPTDEEVIICDENTTAEEVFQPNEGPFVELHRPTYLDYLSISLQC